MTTPYHLEPGASQNNAFTAWMDGRASIFAAKNPKDNGAAVSAAIARKRDAGLDVPETPMVKRGRPHTTNVYSQAGK